MYPRANSPLALSDDERLSVQRSPGRQEWDQPISKVDPRTSNLNIPRADFLKALNFERLTVRSQLLSSGDRSPVRQATDPLECSEEEDSSVCSEQDTASSDEEDDEVDNNDDALFSEEENPMVNGEHEDEDEFDDDEEDGVDEEDDDEKDEECGDDPVEDKEEILKKLELIKHLSRNVKLDCNHNETVPHTLENELSSKPLPSRPLSSPESVQSPTPEDVDEDYLQCSIVESEADAHVHHVEDLLRKSRDLFQTRNLDDEPVKSAHKTFEELLEEKLKQDTPVEQTNSVPKRPFLRRGEGTARFGKVTPRSASPKKRRVVPADEVVLKQRRNKSPVKTVKSPLIRSPVKRSPSRDSSKSIVKTSSVTQSDSSMNRSRLQDVDLDDIEEFEALEKYADDGYSFSSNGPFMNSSPGRMKKNHVVFADLDEEQIEEVTLMTSPPSSTPRRLKRKIASKIGPAMTVEKDVLIEDYSPRVNGDMYEEIEAEKKAESDDECQKKVNGVQENFDDKDSWTDSIPRPSFLRNGQADKDTPPTSKLVTRLFPSLQPKPEVPKPEPKPEGVMSKALKDKLMELETEIDKFRQENAVLAKIEKERLQAVESLKKEAEDLEKRKVKEMNEIQEMREAEMKKIKNERKLFEKYQKEMRAIPDKNQRREIEDLKSEIADLTDELRKKEVRFSASTNRLRSRIETLEKENSELQEEVRLIEKQRQELWAKELRVNQEKKKVPRQQNTVDEAMENGHSEALRQKFDKLLRASLDDFESKESQPRQVSKQPAGNAPTQIVLPLTSSTGSNGTDSKSNPMRYKMNKPDTKIDFGDGNYREFQHKDGRTERTFTNGSKQVIFANGSRKQISADGRSIIISFFNGDLKQTLPDKRVIYYHADSMTKHTTHPDGTEVLEFPNQQVEKHYANGTREIIFPDQTIKYLYPSGAEESVFIDGTVVKVSENGGRVMEFPNGQKEIHTKDYKRREYPDGTTKTVYPDGRQETRYSSGRVRIKNAEGEVVMDTVR